jgi:hypothetical protein
VCQALAEAERIKAVREAQIDVDLFGFPIHVHFQAGGVVRERFAARYIALRLWLADRDAPDGGEVVPGHVRGRTTERARLGLVTAHE